MNALGIDFRFNGDYFLFEVDNFEGLIENLKAIEFIPLDQKDIKIVPIPITEGLVLDVLKHERIKILFQPIIDVKNKRIYGYEALS